MYVHVPGQCWEPLVEVTVDVRNALERAFQEGHIDNFDRWVLLHYYFRDMTMAEIAASADVHEDVIRRAINRALRALRETGYLDGY
jgi:DNA-directed RNA polymerase specialized sigma24 family protein